MAWPSAPYTLGNQEQDRLAAYGAWSNVANAIVKFEPVKMLARTEDLVIAKSFLDPNIELIACELNDGWMRDIGPTFVKTPENKLFAVDWQFNGWGAQGDWANWDLDDQVASVVAKLQIPSMRHLTLEALKAAQSRITEIEFIRARHAVTEIARVMDAVKALRASDFVTLGKLINESHNSLRDDYAVSCPELDVAVDASLAAGALGSRMVGGGFGGSAIALVKQEDIEKVKSSVTSAFEAKRYKKPRFFTSLPSAGASASRY